MNSKDHGNSQCKDNREDSQLREGLGGQTRVKGKKEDRQGSPGPQKPQDTLGKTQPEA